MAELQNTIEIEFKAKGDTALIDAIKRLDKATRGLVRSQGSLQVSTGGVSSAQKKMNKNAILGVRNLRNMKTGANKTSVAFSVLRSKLLLASFAISLFSTTAGKSIKAMGKQEDAEKKLAQAIKSTGNATGITSKKMLAFASDLQAVTKFGDEAIISAQALMLTFTQIGRDTFPEAIKASLNLSEAMGQDLRQTVLQVGKALNDPIQGMSSLRRVGIQLSKQQQQQVRDFIAMNDVASAQKVILGELEVQFGGMATTASKTLTGSLIQLKNAWGDLLERIGKEIAPVISSMATALLSSTRMLMTEQEKEIAILQQLGFNEEFINEKRMVMYANHLQNLQDEGIAMQANWDTTALGIFSLKTLEHQYGLLNTALKDSKQAVQSDEEAVNALGKAWGLSRDEMEFVITQQTKLASSSLGLSDIMVHPIKSLSLLGDVLTATTNEQFNLIVANRVESQSIDEKQKKYQDFMVTMRGLLELMGHDFPETIVTATMTLQEQFNLWGEYNKQITQTISAIGGMTKAQDERAKREEIASANSIQNEAKRQSTIDAIDVKYDKKQQDRSKKMKIWKQASALSNTALSATQVLADETIKPSWLKFPIAGLMIAQGLAQVATIEAQAFAKGGDFVTNKPEMIMVGEAGREHVKITPIDRPESRALKDGGLTINVSAPLVDETILDTIIPAIEKAHRMNLA